MPRSEDRPTAAEAEADMRDDRNPMEMALDLNAWFGRAEDGSYVVHVGGYPSRQSLLVRSIEVARALVTILNLTDPGELDLILTCLIRAYGDKCVITDKLPQDDGYEPDDQWDDEDPAF